MELSPRKKAVLAAVVKAYIETGEPIGSKILMELIDNAPSSATLRNEMNELCGLGLLFQPHTSAGRIPTSSGYSFYINSLMRPDVLSESTKNYINASLSDVGANPRNIPKKACQVLCELTGFPAIYCYMVNEDVYLKRTELLPVGRRSAVLLLITSDGRTQSRICRLSTGFSDTLLESFEKISAFLKRKPLSFFNMVQLQNIIATNFSVSFELLPIITELFDMASTARNSKAEIVGTSNLYNICAEPEARKIISLGQHPERLLLVLGDESQKTEAIFGNDIGFSEFADKAIVVSKYNSGNRYCGKIGIIGQGRMSYEQILPSIEYTASSLTKLMTEAESDMED